jgi:uncharacterized protein DUF6504
MSRRVHQPVPVETAPDGKPHTFTWHGVTYYVRVIGHWRLATRWWDAGREVDRTYYRVETADHQLFELYCDAAQGHGWVLDVIQD